MNILVTAGNTQTPIDKVRCITNVFTGRTGARLAVHCHAAGHAVGLLTSHPEALEIAMPDSDRWQLHTYRSFDELESLMQSTISSGTWDAIVHCAAVSDYRTGGVYEAVSGTKFRPEDGTWTCDPAEAPRLREQTAAKIKSDQPELWLRLLRTPKLVDAIRSQWHFQGILVKFKLEAGVGDDELIERAEQSRRQSDADLMVANTLEDSRSWAILGPIGGKYIRVSREQLAPRVLEAIERIHSERRHG